MCRKLIYLVSFVLVLGLAAGLANAQSVKINFQQPGSETPEGYLPDTSQVFGDRGNGFSYGWDVAFDETRDRNSSNAPDQRYDTLNHLQKAADRIWEIALDNGIYDIFLVCGDPGYTDQTNNFDVEGTILIDPDGQDNFDEYELTVVLSDGRLTIKPAEGSDNCKICFVDITLAIPRGAPTNPKPANEATDVPREVVLGWTPGEFAPPVNGHKVYLSESFTDVNDAIGGITQDANSYAPDPRLDFGTTYYWRIEEVNGPPDYTVYQGEVWSFTTEPVGYPIENITATASSSHQADMGPENTINGSGLDANDLHSKEPTDMWLSSVEPLGAWIQYEFDKIYKLHEMLVWNSNQMVEPMVGFGFKGVTTEHSTNGTDWTTLDGAAEFAQAPGADGYAHNTTVNFGGVSARYVRLTASNNWGGIMPQFGLSEVRFLYVPIRAREPYPDSGAADVDPDVTLGFRAGREAATHDVYVSIDEQAVIDGTAPVTTVTEASYGPLSLDLGKIYYWKTNEVNMAETPTMLEGDVWNFTTRDFLIVDDFEAYNDLNPEDPESNRIFLAWLDGYGIDTNGSIVGYDAPPFAEQNIVHSGEQSMPLAYNNTGAAAYSEAELTLSPSQDWTKAGIATLVLYFRGNEGNTGQLYVKINDSKVVYDGDAADIATLRWKQWNIDLASVGTNLQSVTKLSIGVDSIGAGGTLYVDDIRLYRSAPEIVVPSEEIWIEAESAATITDPLKIYDDPLASGGKCIGTTDDVGNSSDSPPSPAGTATYTFTVAGGIYKITGRIIIPSGDSFWVRIPSATNLTPGEDPDNPGTGWVRWSDPDDSEHWYWADVFSGDHDAEVANWTLPAGTHTLEIAYREDAALWDVIVISKID